MPSGARASEDLDALAGGERDDGALGVLALAHLRAPAALALALAVDRVHAVDLHVEDLLHGDLDLRLVRLGQHDERVLTGVDQAVALLGDDRGEQDVPGVADAHAFSSVVSSAATSTAAAFFAGAFVAAAFSAGASAARSRSVVPWSSSIEGMAPGMSGVVRSGFSTPRPLPFAGPATYSASAVSVKTTSSEISTSYVLSWPASIRCTWGTLRRLTQFR